MILLGDALEQLRALDDESVQCCVTSPPYWGLRNYGHDGQIGLEETPQEYIEKMVEVFREVRRVLKKDGTLWLNLGDSYSSGGERSSGRNDAGRGGNDGFQGGQGYGDAGGKIKIDCNDGLKPKDLCMIPARVAIALQADGWWLRQDIIWSKPNPMPESVKDRCTKSHEYVFLLSKSARYYFDADAIAEPLTYTSIERLSQDIDEQSGSDRVPGKTNGKMKAVYKEPYTGSSTKDYEDGGAQDASETKKRIVDRILAGEIIKRNKRDVWTITTQPYAEAHFATMPQELAKTCILAGSKAGDIVLDPFGGSGTTGQAAESLGRKWILIELNEKYIPLIKRRTAQTGMVI